jgi:hypothetical protein
MAQRLFLAAIVGCFLTLGARSGGAATPREVVGFWGTVTGTVKSARPDGMSFVLTISKAEADEQHSTVKDTAPMIGKNVTLGTRMPRKDGKPSANPEDIAYIKTLKPGTTITIKIFAVQADPTVMRIQGPGTSTEAKGKTGE